MKKLLLVLSICNLFFTLPVNNSFDGKKGKVIFDELSYEPLKLEIENYNVSKKENLKDFSGLETKSLGKIYKNKEFESVTNKKMKTYQSGAWGREWDNVYIMNEDLVSRTFYFEKYIDIPLCVLDSEKVIPNSGEEITKFEREVNINYSYLESYSNAVRYMSNYSNTLGIKSKAGLTIQGVVEAGAETNGSTTFSLTHEDYQSWSTAESWSFNLNDKISHTLTIVNNESYTINYRVCYRQLYKIGFVTTYEAYYKEESWKQGLFGMDYCWSYKFEYYIPKSLNYLLIPIGEPYFQFSKYKVNSKGEIDSYIDDGTMSDVFFL